MKPKPRWPRTVPVVEADDMCVCVFDGPNDTHCALGWAYKMFGIVTPTLPASLLRAFRKAAFAICGTRDVVVASDVRCRTNAQRARIVNLATALLGYTVGNPEAKTAARLKRNKKGAQR